MNQKINENNPITNSNIVNKNPNSTETPRKHYDADFRNQVIEVCKSGTYASIAECARSYGLKENTLYNWLHKSKNPVLTNVDPEYVNLKKENAKLRMELEILKKAAIYFANHAR